MDDSSAIRLPSQTTPSTLRRWNSTPTFVVVPHRPTSYGTTTTTSPNTHSPASLLDLELVSIKSPFYTSLRDVLHSSAAAVNSPTASSPATNSPCYISIRNRLVKQAAWAYLQPMSASPHSPSGPDFLRRLSDRFSSCLRFILHQLVPGTTGIYYRILRAFRRHVSI